MATVAYFDLVREMENAFNHRLRLVHSARRQGLKKTAREFGTTVGTVRKWLAGAREGFSGAEIEQAIASGLCSAFSQKQQLSSDIVLAELRGTRPLCVTRQEDIAALRAWARDRTVRAN